MRTLFEHNVRLRSRHLTELKDKTADLERQLQDARASLDRELADFSGSPELTPEQIQDIRLTTTGPQSFRHGQRPAAEDRTEVLVTRGRRSAYRPGLSRWQKIAIGVAPVAVLGTVLMIFLSSGGASWPASVGTVQREAAVACQNPDVRSEPSQVNFACGKDTRQILWVFALLTSGAEPGFADARTGRLGLEPITPAQGGEVAWSLNLHHPYDPSSPVDSLQVAARAINNIIGGATLISARGRPVVQPGLESHAANCLRYTGSASMTERNGFPGRCARPVTSPAGEAALVADIYQKWVVGAAVQDAQDAAVLFENARHPGNPQVVAILRQLPGSRLAG